MLGWSRGGAQDVPPAAKLAEACAMLERWRSPWRCYVVASGSESFGRHGQHHCPKGFWSGTVLFDGSLVLYVSKMDRSPCYGSRSQLKTAIHMAWLLSGSAGVVCQREPDQGGDQR